MISSYRKLSAQTEVGGEEARGTGRVAAKRPAAANKAAARGAAEAARKAVTQAGLLQRLNFWGTYDVAGETRRGGEER